MIWIRASRARSRKRLQTIKDSLEVKILISVLDDCAQLPTHQGTDRLHGRLCSLCRHHNHHPCYVRYGNVWTYKDLQYGPVNLITYLRVRLAASQKQTFRFQECDALLGTVPYLDHG